MIVGRGPFGRCLKHAPGVCYTNTVKQLYNYRPCRSGRAENEQCIICMTRVLAHVPCDIINVIVQSW